HPRQGECSTMVNLTGSGRRFSLNHHSWQHLLQLATMYGWQPTRDEDQPVTDEDARGLAGVLERALADLPDGDALDRRVSPTGPVQGFAGRGKQLLRRLVAFCQPGGCVVRCAKAVRFLVHPAVGGRTEL